MDSGKWLNRFSLDLESKYTNSLQTRNNYKSCISVFLERFKNFVELNNAGICCFLFDAPHNRRYDVGYKRIKSLSELV